jgi:transposase-like protein
MRMPRGKKTDTQLLLETVQDILIVVLAKAGVSQMEIRKILAVDIVKVNRIAKHIKPRRR